MNEQAKRPLVFAVDFDGTIAHTEFPAIISENKEVTGFMRQARANGDRIIIWTCREGKHLEEALAWINERDIPYDLVNENFQDWIDFFDSDCRKVGCDYFIDDKAIYPSDVSELSKRLYGHKSEVGT